MAGSLWKGFFFMARERSTFPAGNLRLFQFSCHCRLRQTRFASQAARRAAAAAAGAAAAAAALAHITSTAWWRGAAPAVRCISPAFLIRVFNYFHGIPPRRGYSIYEINRYTQRRALASGENKKKKNYLDELAPIPYFDYTARSSHCACIDIHVYVHFH